MLKKIFTGLVIASAIIYIVILCQVLFRGFGRAVEMVMMSEDMKYNYFNSINLVPFKTIIEYVTGYIDGSMRGNAIRNLVGNLLLLFPLGFYLPFFMKKLSSVKIYSAVVAVFIIIIEVTQLITKSGSLDIDDFILNFIGAMIGFIICKYTPIRSLFNLRPY